MNLTPEAYRTLRRQGFRSQREAAAALGVSLSTIAHRERGDPRYPISVEAYRAMRDAVREVAGEE